MKKAYKIINSLLLDKTAMNNILKTVAIIVAGVVIFIFSHNISPR